MKNWFLYFVFILSVSSKVHGWWDVPHMLIAQIAKDNLDASTSDQVEEILSYFEEDFPASSSFITASCFPDDITSLGLSGFKVWHGMLKPYSPDNFLSEESLLCIEALINDNNLHSGINQSVKTLRNPAASKWEKSFLLRFLLHCVADIHQPLHCIQLYSKQFPSGDLAGHRFNISGMPYRNLHHLWDAAFGIGNKEMVRPLCREDAEWIKKTANFICAAYKQNSLPESQNMTIEDWSKESYQLAINIAYNGIQPGEIPSQDYLKRGEQTAIRQIALAGYRLANILHDVFENDAAEVKF